MARDELASLAASEDALPVLVGGTGVYVQSVLDGWDLTGTRAFRRSLERDFPRSDFQGAYHVLARLAPEVARRVHPSNYEAILNAVVRRKSRRGGQGGGHAVCVRGVRRRPRESGDRPADRDDVGRPDQSTGCWRRLPDSTAGTGSSSRLVGQGVGATWRGEAHGYRESVCVTASTGKAIAELDGADLAAARAEALGHIWAYSRRQRSWFRKLGASRVDHRSAVKTIVSRLQ